MWFAVGLFRGTCTFVWRSHVRTLKTSLMHYAGILFCYYTKRRKSKFCFSRHRIAAVIDNVCWSSRIYLCVPLPYRILCTFACRKFTAKVIYYYLLQLEHRTMQNFTPKTLSKILKLRQKVLKIHKFKGKPFYFKWCTLDICLLLCFYQVFMSLGRRRKSILYHWNRKLGKKLFSLKRAYLNEKVYH